MPNPSGLPQIQITASPSRRDALQRLSSGVLLLFTVKRSNADEEKVPAKKQVLLTSRLHIATDGTITLLTGKVECGQGIRTTLTQVAAEELHVPSGQVRLIMGDTALVPDDGGTWGSLTTPEAVPVIRQACAAMHDLLCRTAATHWQVASSSLTVVNGQVSGPDGRTYSYGRLASDPSLATATNMGSVATKPATWQVCGQPLANVNGPAIVSGGHQYSSDLTADRMLHGRVARAPNHRCRLLSYDGAKAESLPGVRIVHDGDFLGVTAPTAALAATAITAIPVQWSSEQLGDPDKLFDDLKARAKPPQLKEFGRYPSLLQQGSVSEGIAAAAHQFTATYSLPHITHVPLEARTAIAHWQNGSLTVRCGTQAPFVVRAEIAKAFHAPVDSVRVVVSDTGSGYGAKHNSECELEAARLAYGIDQPVRLAWTRTDEFTQSYCRPAALIEVRSGVAQDGHLLAWEFHNYNGGAASLTPPYQVPNLYAAYHESQSPLRQGSYRSLAAVGNNFARETHIDEIAAALHIDPLEFRLQNTENARLKIVLHRAAERFGWAKRKAGNGVGYGLACNLEKGGHLALFTELQVDGENVRLTRMVAAFDAGAVINPDILSNQVEGAIIQGIGGALFEQLAYDQKRILTNHLADYRVPRFQDIPEIDVILVDHRDIVSAGAGESPITASAPSIASALFSATGLRLRSLPLLPLLGSPSASPRRS